MKLESIIEFFFPKKKKVSYISEEAFNRIMAQKERELEEARARNEREEALCKPIYNFQCTGMDLEREKKYEDAIQAYENAVMYAEDHNIGWAAYTYSLERLCVLYRRQKEYEKEKRCCRQIVRICPHEKTREKYRQRNDKVVLLQMKQKKLKVN